MTEHGSRTGAVRDVPPPRPVTPSAPELEETGLGRAARAVADAVAGLVGGRTGGDASAADGRARMTAAGLRDVVGAVAGAVASAFGPAPTDRSKDAGAERSSGAVLGDLLAAAAPRLPIRDAAALRAAYPGASEEEIAEALVARAARVTGGIGAATGGLTAAMWFAPPSLLALPLELGAETVLTGGVEVVLIGELHELYGRPVSGDARTRAAAYLASWSAQRSVDGAAAGLGAALGVAGVRALSRRMTRKLARSVPAAAPFMIGAAIAGRGNRRATESLAEQVLADLRQPRPGAAGS